MELESTISNAHVGAIHTVSYNSTGKYFLSGGQDRKIHLWNPSNGLKINSYLRVCPNPLTKIDDLYKIGAKIKIKLL